MKKILISLITLSSIAAVYAQSATSIFDEPKKQKEEYHFSVSWRIAASYQQDWLRSDKTYPDAYLHGGKIGVSVDFNLPYHLSLQTGLHYSLTGNQVEQHWLSVSEEEVQKEYIKHGLMKHNIDIPLHLYYQQKLWRELRLVFFTGPTLQIGVAFADDPKELHLSNSTKTWLQSNGIPTSRYDKYKEKELYRTNIQWAIGGGIEWDRYRLYSGYEFGLNDCTHYYPQNAMGLPYSGKLNQWGWFVGFAYQIK